VKETEEVKSSLKRMKNQTLWSMTHASQWTLLQMISIEAALVVVAARTKANPTNFLIDESKFNPTLYE